MDIVSAATLLFLVMDPLGNDYMVLARPPDFLRHPNVVAGVGDLGIRN